MNKLVILMQAKTQAMKVLDHKDNRTYVDYTYCTFKNNATKLRAILKKDKGTVS
jgi:hypothetical protein